MTTSETHNDDWADNANDDEGIDSSMMVLEGKGSSWLHDEQ